MPCAIAPLVVESDEELGTRRKVSGIENAGIRNWAIGLSFIFLAVGCVAWVLRDRRDPLRTAPTESVTEAVGLPQEGTLKSKFVTNSPWKTWRFRAGQRSLIDAFKDAFPNEKDWWATSFPASNHPDKTWWWQDVVYWAQYELLNRTNHTFPDGKVPIPVAKHGDDQLDPDSNKAPWWTLSIVTAYFFFPAAFGTAEHFALVGEHFRQLGQHPQGKLLSIIVRRYPARSGDRALRLDRSRSVAIPTRQRPMKSSGDNGDAAHQGQKEAQPSQVELVCRDPHGYLDSLEERWPMLMNSITDQVSPHRQHEEMLEEVSG